VRLALGLLAVLATSSISAGCGSTRLCHRQGILCENLPQTKAYTVSWVERAPQDAAIFRVRKITVGAHGWTIEASVENGSPSTFTFPTGGARSPISFGLGVFTTQLPRRVEDPGNYLLRPRTVEPPFPAKLGPGQKWSGTMSSPVPPRPNRWLRVLFGVFFWEGKPPYPDYGKYFAWQTSGAVQAPPPRGPDAPEPTTPSSPPR
jgi:hypothetical protein